MSLDPHVLTRGERGESARVRISGDGTASEPPSFRKTSPRWGAGDAGAPSAAAAGEERGEVDPARTAGGLGRGGGGGRRRRRRRLSRAPPCLGEPLDDLGPRPPAGPGPGPPWTSATRPSRIPPPSSTPPPFARSRFRPHPRHCRRERVLTGICARVPAPSSIRGCDEFRLSSRAAADSKVEVERPARSHPGRA